MTRALRSVVIAALVLAAGGVAVAVVALVSLHSTRQRLDGVERRLAVVASKSTQRQGTEPALNALQDQVTQLADDVGNLRDRNACPDSLNTYYQRLLGAQEAGADVSAYIDIITSICPSIDTTGSSGTNG